MLKIRARESLVYQDACRAHAWATAAMRRAQTAVDRLQGGNSLPEDERDSFIEEFHRLAGGVKRAARHFKKQPRPRSRWNDARLHEAKANYLIQMDGFREMARLLDGLRRSRAMRLGAVSNLLGQVREVFDTVGAYFKLNEHYHILATLEAERVVIETSLATADVQWSIGRIRTLEDTADRLVMEGKCVLDLLRGGAGTRSNFVTSIADVAAAIAFLQSRLDELQAPLAALAPRQLFDGRKTPQEVARAFDGFGHRLKSVASGVSEDVLFQTVRARWLDTR